MHKRTDEGEFNVRKYLVGIAGAALLALLVVTACSGGAAVENVVPQQSLPGEQPTEAVAPVEPVPTEAPADAPASPTVEEVPPTAEAAAAEPVAFAIVPQESEARFVIQEVLAGVDTTVVGVTNAVEGQLYPNFVDPAQTTVGAIRVDLSTLQTDNGFRNRALRDAILQTANPEYQYATFTPTALNGLPESITLGQPFDFEIAGDLLIRGVTRPVTFLATAMPVSETRIEGRASLTIPYTEFVTIPRLPPQVASVDENVTLELDFVAVPVQ